MKHSELVEMIRRVVRAKKKEMKEAKVVPANFLTLKLPESDIETLQLLMQDFSEETEDYFPLHEFVSSTYYIDEYNEDEPEYTAIKKIFEKYPNGARLVGNPLPDPYFFPPGAPSNSFEALIEINPKKNSIRVSTPTVGKDSQYMVGWFDSLGKYHPDTKNFDKDRNYIGNNNVDEAKIIPTAIMSRTLPLSDVDDINTLTEFFGDGDSGFSLYTPLDERYNLEDYCEDGDEEDNTSQCKALKNLIRKYPSGAKFVGNIFNNIDFSPGAPPNSFEALIEINPEYVRVSTPYVDDGGNYLVGWFDIKGNYYPDTKNFDYRGDRIGGNDGNLINVDEAKIIPAGSLNRTPEEMQGKIAMIKCLKALLEKTSKNEPKKLNLKIGRYNASGEEFGIEMTWDEGQSFLSSVTRRNAENLFNKLNITPEKVYIGVVPTRCAYSYYITGTFNNNPIAIARKETSSSMAGQTYLITPNMKKQLSAFDIEYNINDLEEAKIVPVNVMTQKWASENDLPKNIEIDWDWDLEDEYEEINGYTVVVYGTTYGKDQQGNTYKADVKTTRDVLSRGDDTDNYYYNIERIELNKN